MSQTSFFFFGLQNSHFILKPVNSPTNGVFSTLSILEKEFKVPYQKIKSENG